MKKLIFALAFIGIFAVKGTAQTDTPWMKGYLYLEGEFLSQHFDENDLRTNKPSDLNFRVWRIFHHKNSIKNLKKWCRKNQLQTGLNSLYQYILIDCEIAKQNLQIAKLEIEKHQLQKRIYDLQTTLGIETNLPPFNEEKYRLEVSTQEKRLKKAEKLLSQF